MVNSNSFEIRIRWNGDLIMKKVSITLLLVLPIVLIYAISILGKIYASVAHIAPEYVAVFVDNIRQEEGVVLNYDIDEDGYDAIPLDIRVMPELASNRSYKVSNNNPTASEIVVDSENNASLFLKDKGISTYTVSCVEKPSLKCTFKVNVEFGLIRGIEFFDTINPSVNITELNLPLGREKNISVEYLPVTTRPEFREIEWSFESDGHSLEEMGEFFPIQVRKNAENTSQIHVLGFNAGDVLVTATCKTRPEISAQLLVKVTNKDETSRAYFNYFDPEYAMNVIDGTFDFKSEGGTPEDSENEGKILFNDSGLSYDDVSIRINGGESYVDQSIIEDLVLKFTNEKAATVNVELYLKSEPGTVVDRITLFVPKQSLWKEK